MKKKQITSMALKIAYPILCNLIPTKKNKLAFLSQPDASDNSWHLYKYIATNLSGYHLVWLCANPKKARNKISKIATQNKVSIKKSGSLLGLLHFISSRYIFSSHGTYHFVKKTNGPEIVNLWHGMPIKMIGILNGESPSYCDYTFSTSKFYTEIIANSFGIDKNRVLQFGLPRNDALKSKIEKNELEIRQKLCVSKDIKIIIWLPTFRTTRNSDTHRDAKIASFLDEWQIDFLDRANNLAKKQNCYFLIKLHHMDSLNQSGDEINLSNLRVVKSDTWQSLEIDLYEMLSCSSALITDLSSVLIDYTLTQNPIAITTRSQDDYTRKTIPEIGRLLEPCYKISTLDDLNNFASNLNNLKLNGQDFAFFNEGITKKQISCEEIVTFFLRHNHKSRN